MNCFDQYHSEVIFFVSDQHPSSKWEIIKRYFSNLIYIECSYSDQEDLNKLKLDKAKHVFILTWAVENSNVNDSGILPLVKIIEENFQNCKYTLELSDELNVRYLNNKGMDPEEVGKSGLHNKEKTFVEKDKEKDAKRKTPNERIPFRIWPKYAKSDIFFSSSLESLLAFSYHNEGLLDVLTKLLGISEFHDDEYKENDEISMFRYVGQDKYLYDKVFTMFTSLDEPVIPIAVYRYNPDPELKNESSYIITNPKKELMLNRYDQVICIGKSTTRVFTEFNKDNLKEEDSNQSENSEGDNDFLTDNLIMANNANIKRKFFLKNDF